MIRQEVESKAFVATDFRRVRRVAFAGFLSALITSQSSRMAATTIFASPECAFFSSFLKDAETDFSGVGCLRFLVMSVFLSSDARILTCYRRGLSGTFVKACSGCLILRPASIPGGVVE